MWFNTICYVNFSNNSINSIGIVSNNIDEQSNSSNNTLKSMINKIQCSKKEMPVNNIKNKNIIFY